MSTCLPGKSAIFFPGRNPFSKDLFMNVGTQMIATADIIKQLRPAYAAILEFYSRVFAAQEKSKETIRIPPIEMDSDLLAARKKNALPLIDPSEFRIDRDAAVALFKEICDLALDWAPHLAEDAAVMKTALQDGRIDADAVFSTLLDSRLTPLENKARAVGVPVEHLSRIIFLCMAPSIETAAQQLGGHLAPLPGLKNGTCPVCGNAANMGFLDDTGSCHLICCFCHHTWKVRRMSCAFCGNQDMENQGYFFSDREKEYRVCWCDRCRHYIKVVDLRHLSRDFFPKLEMAATLHLDMQATEKGYQG
jgi:FdhE protein